MLAPGRPVHRPPKRRSINPINLPCAPAQRALWAGLGACGEGGALLSCRGKLKPREGVESEETG